MAIGIKIMLTLKQEKWIAHLRDDDHIVIKPYDQTASEKFESVKKKIQSMLGNAVKVEHHGATSLEISGQDEIDVYVPVPLENFNSFLPRLKQLFGNPRSLYQLERARFIANEEGKRIDIFLINETSPDWINAVKFEKYLRENYKELDSYRKLKEECNGLSTQEYYRRKIEFINAISGKINTS